MNVLPHRTLLADDEKTRRARVRQALLGELPGLRPPSGWPSRAGGGP